MLKTNTLFIGWNYPRGGHERQAGEMFQACIQFFTKHVEAKNITGFEPVMLTLHGGDMNGFFLVRGDHAKLEEIRNSEEFLKLTMQLNTHIDGIGIMPAFHGEAVGAMMGEWMKLVG